MNTYFENSASYCQGFTGYTPKVPHSFGEAIHDIQYTNIYIYARYICDVFFHMLVMVNELQMYN